MGIFTGEPLILTKASQLPTDLLTGGFSPETVVGLFALSVKLERTGEPRILVEDEGTSSFLGKEMVLDEQVLATGDNREGGEEAQDWESPPSTKPLPLKGIIFRMSCNPEPWRQRYEIQNEPNFSLMPLASRERNTKV